MTILQRTQLIVAMVAKGYSPIGAYNESIGPNAEKYLFEYVTSHNRIVINDIFVGNWSVTQLFGKNPAMYSKFGWKGHNGIDFGMPIGTRLMSGVNGKVVEAYDDVTGWGKHIYIYDASQKFMTLHAHLSRIDVKVGQEVTIGQNLGLSGNTGNSTGPHLHFGGYKTTDAGYKTDIGNGYGGAINCFDKSLVTWHITNPTKAH